MILEEDEPGKSEVFDQYLVKYDRSGALSWAETQSGEKPWDSELKGCLAFARQINGKVWPARIKAEETLRSSPFNEWANAVAFIFMPKVDWSNPPDEAMTIARCLDEVWILRFECLGFLYEALDLCRYYLTYGNEFERRRVVADMYVIWYKDPYIRRLIGSGDGV